MARQHRPLAACSLDTMAREGRSFFSRPLIATNAAGRTQERCGSMEKRRAGSMKKEVNVFFILLMAGRAIWFLATERPFSRDEISLCVVNNTYSDISVFCSAQPDQPRPESIGKVPWQKALTLQVPRNQQYYTVTAFDANGMRLATVAFMRQELHSSIEFIPTSHGRIAAHRIEINNQK